MNNVILSLIRFLFDLLTYLGESRLVWVPKGKHLGITLAGFLQARCTSCYPTSTVKSLKEKFLLA